MSRSRAAWPGGYSCTSTHTQPEASLLFRKVHSGQTPRQGPGARLSPGFREPSKGG